LGWVLPTLITIFGVILTVATIIVYIKFNSKLRKIDLRENAAIIDCTTKTQFTNGYSMGYVIKEEPCPNKTHRITFYPTDREQGEDIDDPEPQTFIVANEMIKRMPKGSGSTRRERLYVLSRNPADIPEHLRDTELGNWLSKEGQLAYIQKVYGSNISAGDEALETLMRETTRLGITKGELLAKKKLIKEILKFNILKEGEKDAGASKSN